jgi:hypothetical protein
VKKNESVCPILSVILSQLVTNISPEILRIHLRDEKLSEDVNLRNIASKTSYYSGSDLKSKLLLFGHQLSYQHASH